MEVGIIGTLDLTFFELNGVAPVTESRQAEIEKKLQSGDYIISLVERRVIELPNYENVATFQIEVMSGTEYDFNPI